MTVWYASIPTRQKGELAPQEGSSLVGRNLVEVENFQDYRSLEIIVHMYLRQLSYPCLPVPVPVSSLRTCRVIKNGANAFLKLAIMIVHRFPPYTYRYRYTF